MNNKYFRSEIHSYLDDLYTEFEEYQNDVLETLIEFNRLCSLRNIEYYVGFGSLLGFFRNGNLLPWDYDIDVIVPIYEKKKLIKTLNKELDPKFYYYCPEVDEKCRHYCIRITKKDFNSSAIHMDIFFLIGAPEDKNKREGFRKKVKKINRIRKIKLVNAKEESMGINTFRIARNIKKIIYFPISIKVLNLFYNYLCHKINYENAKYVTTMQAAADTYNKNIFGKPTIIEIKGNKFKAPSDIIGFLNSTYSNYESIPPICSRFDEFYQSIQRLKYFNNGNKVLNKSDFQINNYK
ncbi:LicD family protein [Vallitalea okinawensis]|uniref:LicD family protein n=1 Tax=Vallitalea okinawensis TaxID=2078660 RepID=UPI000CFC270A|nr:LicD family protein [Vallitalea okinawensis]